MIELDRNLVPPPLARRPFRFPDFEVLTWANGLRVYACPQREFPLLVLEALSLAGAEHDPPALPGLAALHGELLDEGTATRRSLEIAYELEYLGGGLMTGSGWNGVSGEILTLGEHLAPAADILADCWRAAVFPEQEVSRLRDESAADLLQRRIQPAALADDRFSAMVYGASAYGRPLIGTPEALAAIGRDEIVAFRDRHLLPNNSALVVVGDFAPDALWRRLEEHFAAWPAAAAAPEALITPRVLEGLEIHVVDRPGAVQVQLQVGQAGVPRRHPDFAPLLLLNVILGGKFTSRINLNLRERHGFTYGANSYLVARRGPGPFFVRTAVGSENAGAALRETLAELDRICQEPVTEDELRDAQDYIIGVFPSSVQTIHDITQRLETLFLHDLPDDYFSRYPELLATYRPEDLLAAARRHLRPGRMAVVAVGEAATLLPQLEGYGPITVHAPG